MELDLKSKKAFISGSTQGIGFAVARQLLAEGANVIINGRGAEKTKSAVDKLKREFPHGDVIGIAADFSETEEVDSLLERLGDVDILINNVGVFELRGFNEVTDSEWMDIFQINVMSGVRLSRHLLPGMLQKGLGRIVFISSESGVNVPGNMIHYGVTKAAMMALANGLAKLTKGTAVTVNTILGGPTYSDGVAATLEHAAKSQSIGIEEMKSAILHQTNPDSLLQRFIEPAEIAALAAYLSSPVSSATNGACLRADGWFLKTV